MADIPRWTVEVIPAAEREINALPDDLQGKFLHVAGLLQEFGPVRVGLPHVRPLRGKLWEIRMAGRNSIARALYFGASGRRLVVVRVFVKKSQKTPRREIALAERRMEEQNG
jgi:phage-related protein